MARSGNELVTLHVRTRHQLLAVAVDRVRTPVAGNTAHSRKLGCSRRDLERRNRTQGPASARVVGSPPAARTRLSDRCRSRGCSGPQHIRSGDQRFQRGGQARPPTLGESDFPSHRRIDHHV